MSQVTEDLVRCFLRLKAPEFKPLVDWFSEIHQKALEDMSQVNDEANWRRLQGRSTLAREVCKLVGDADGLMGKFKQ